jgi:hypothetical protein
MPIEKFLTIVKAADHAKYDFNDKNSDWKRKCKTILEVDRSEAAMELGYSVKMYKLIPEEASPKNDIIVGIPSK